MKKILTILGLMLSVSMVYAQNDVNCTASDNWVGYMNVFNLGGGYEFGSSWGVADLKTTIDSAGNTITLQPNFNTYADNPGDPFWIDTLTQEGNKNMEASTFVEPGATFNGSDLTFRGTVNSNTLDTNYTAQYFIKALDPNSGFADALGGAYIMDLPASGDFTVTVPASSLTTGLIIQYGFVIVGRNANPANEATLGSIEITSQATTTSVSNLEAQNTVKIFPNPAQNVLNIQADAQIQQLRVVNLQGQTVKLAQEFNAPSIDISDLAAGTYFVEFQTATSREIQKFVKQ
jgi:hypothetical protein